MKLLLLIVLGITLAEAKPKKPERVDDEECSDALPEEACQMIAINRGCIEDETAQKCKKTCKVCQVCEDTSSYYCEVELENGLLDCNRGEHADYCKKTCLKCSEKTASKTNDEAGSRKLKSNKRGEKTAYKTNDEAGSRKLKSNKRGERSASKTNDKAGSRKLKSNKRADDDCIDTEEEEFCSNMLTTGQCMDSKHKGSASKCAKTCGLCFVCEDVSSLCDTEGIDVCDQEDLEHFCLKACNKCGAPSLALAWTIRAVRAMNYLKAGDPLAHLLRQETGTTSDCEDISQLCNYKNEAIVDVCDTKNEVLQFCLKTCNKCNAESAACSLKIKAQMATSDKEAVDPLAHLMRKERDTPSKCEDISPVCPRTKGADACEHKDLVQYCLKTCGKCNKRSLKHALKVTAPIEEDHPKVKDPLKLRFHKHTECKDSSIHCMTLINDPSTKDICNHEDTLVYCLKSCNKCNQRSLLPMASMTDEAEDPLEHLVRQEPCVDKSVDHCMKVANDNYCGMKELAKECPRTCGLCGQKKRHHDTLHYLDDNCKDDVEHCEEIKHQGMCENFELNHICKLTCGLCKP